MKIIAFITASIATFAITAHPLSTDTLGNYRFPRQVTITQTGDTTQVVVTTRNEDGLFDHHFVTYSDTTGETKLEKAIEPNKSQVERDKAKVKLFFGDVRLGAGNAKVNIPGVNIDYVSEVGILNVLGLKYIPNRRTHLSVGVGFNYQRYVIDRQHYFSKDAETNAVSIKNFSDLSDEELDGRGSDFKLWQLCLPVMYKQSFKYDLFFKLGIVFNWNASANISHSYKIDDTSYSFNTKKIRQNKFSTDMTAAFGYRWFGVYIKYSPMKLFKKEYGPNIKNTWTLGLSIAM